MTGNREPMSEQIMVRVDRDLLAQLKTDAEKNERSVAQSCRYAIRLYLSSRPDPLDSNT